MAMGTKMPTDAALAHEKLSLSIPLASRFCMARPLPIGTAPFFSSP